MILALGAALQLNCPVFVGEEERGNVRQFPGARHVVSRVLTGCRPDDESNFTLETLNVHK